MSNKWLVEAVLNNAAWCDAVAASHGLSTDWNELIWASELPMPPLYPNVVTLKSGILESGILVDEKIDSINAQLPLDWAIKDSFSELDLRDKGFVSVIDAHWYCRVPTRSVIQNKKPHSNVKSVDSTTQLERWVNAWGEGHGIFEAALLENNCIELLYIERDGKMVAGLVTNLSGHSVGISNAFGTPNDLLDCVDSVIAKHPDKGIVGYGTKEEIAALSKFGFQELGDLRVWLRK